MKKYLLNIIFSLKYPSKFLNFVFNFNKGQFREMYYSRFHKYVPNGLLCLLKIKILKNFMDHF